MMTANSQATRAGRFSSLALLILLTVLLAIPGTELCAAPLRATIQKKNGESTVVFLLKASDRAILWKYTPEAAATSTMGRDEIESIEFDEPDGLVEAQSLFLRGDWKAAAEALGKIADDYKDLVPAQGKPQFSSALSTSWKPCGERAISKVWPKCSMKRP